MLKKRYVLKLITDKGPMMKTIFGDPDSAITEIMKTYKILKFIGIEELSPLEV